MLLSSGREEDAVNTLRIGAVLLSVWTGLNLLLAAAILVGLTVLHKNAPAVSILFSDAAIKSMDPKALATINALGVFGNACAAGMCLLALVITWTALAARARWAFWVLVAALAPVQALGFASDGLLGHRNLIANVVSSVILVAGLSLSDHGRRQGKARRA